MQAMIVNGSAEEIAALALAMQGRQKELFIPETADGPCMNGPHVEGQSILAR